MKEIEFRSWNEDIESFIYFINGEYEDEDGYPDSCVNFDWDNAQQYCCEKDKNDNKIYEGSVLRLLSNDESKGYEIVIVHWDKFHSGISITFENDESYIISGILLASRNAEIIGHIYDGGEYLIHHLKNKE